MPRSLVYWPEATDDFALASILAETELEDPNVTPDEDPEDDDGEVAAELD